jgi:hypothetical protein
MQPRAADDIEWEIAGQTAKKQGSHLVVRHTYKHGRDRQVHEYRLAIAHISMAIYESTLKFQTFPFNVPHSHKVTDGKTVTYDRGIDEWDDHVGQKGLLEDSNVEDRACIDCGIDFVDTSSFQRCHACTVKQQAASRKQAMALCRKAEKHAKSTDWKDSADALKALQAEWKTLEPLSRNDSEKLWARFNKATQAFFDARGKFFDKQDKLRAANAKKAEALIKKAEQWSAHKDRRTAADELKKLQQDWKAVNPLPREVADELWQKFRAPCQAFFEGGRRQEATCTRIDETR